MGRRIEKRLFNRKTRWVWDGNVPLHEWNEVYTKDFTEERGEFYNMKPSKTTTWLFEEGTFVPNGKLVGEESFSIQSNYLGTPEVMYNADGKVVWSAELDAYGDVQELTGERTDCPFRYQGQYEDRETGLYYNRFRYYDSSTGYFLNQDPIKLDGGFELYSYVHDTNGWIDILGLTGCPPQKKTQKEPTGGVYILKDRKENVVRTGRTKNLKKREAQHKATYGNKYEFESVYKTDDYKEQRGLEHKIYKQHEATANASNGGLNKIGAISDNNKNKDEYIKASDEYLKRN